MPRLQSSPKPNLSSELGCLLEWAMKRGSRGWFTAREAQLALYDAGCLASDKRGVGTHYTWLQQLVDLGYLRTGNRPADRPDGPRTLRSWSVRPKQQGRSAKGQVPLVASPRVVIESAAAEEIAEAADLLAALSGRLRGLLENR